MWWYDIKQAIIVWSFRQNIILGCYLSFCSDFCWRWVHCVLGLTGLYWALMGLNGPYLALLGLTGPLWAFMALTGIPKHSQLVKFGWLWAKLWQFKENKSYENSFDWRFREGLLKHCFFGCAITWLKIMQTLQVGGVLESMVWCHKTV